MTYQRKVVYDTRSSAMHFSQIVKSSREVKFVNCAKETSITHTKWLI